jgi:hypothetical protein
LELRVSSATTVHANNIVTSAFFAKSQTASGSQLFAFSDGEKEALVYSETPLRSNKASQDVPIALTVTNDVKDQSTAMAAGGVAIASAGLVAAVYKSCNSEARESLESMSDRRNMAPSAVVLSVQGLAIVPAQVLSAEFLCSSISNFNRKMYVCICHMVGVDAYDMCTV